MRPNGTVLFDDSLVDHPAVSEAKTKQRQKQDESRLRAIARAERPLLNKHRYPNLYEKWLAGKAAGYSGKLPNCPRCREAVIHWDEPAHECEFKPMFQDADKVRERMEARRKAIHDAKPESIVVCSVCSEEIPEYEDAEWHWDKHEGVPKRQHHALNGEEDGDLDGYEDEPEEDFCDEDGDPDWD